MVEDKELNRKRVLMLKSDKYERALVEIEKWECGVKLSSSTLEITGEINDEPTKNKWMKVIKDLLLVIKEDKLRNDGKLYLSEIIKKEKPKLSNNNLILSPTGSGKTYFIKETIKKSKAKEALLLVSTTSLKDKLAPNSNEARRELNNRMYDTKNNNTYGDDDYKILVMTYAEFEKKVFYSHDFADNYKYIFCDEFHSIINYNNMNGKDNLMAAIRYLLFYNKNQYKFYFTATDEYILKFKKDHPIFFEHINTIDYLNHPDIMKHLTLSSYKINHLSQVNQHLRARKESFEYFGYKGFGFCKTIESQKMLGKILEKNGFNPLLLWSSNNNEIPMSKEQLKYQEYVLRTGLIPDEFDFLVINSAMQEGWDLLDPKVKLAIINTTNETEYVQSIGRIRQDVDVLVYRTKGNPDYFINFPLKLLNVPLTSDDKNKLRDRFRLRNSNGELLGWKSICEILKNQGYEIVDSRKRVNGKQIRVSTVKYLEIESANELL